MKLLQFPRRLVEVSQVEVFSDFNWYVTAHDFASLAADTNSAVSVADGARGILTIDTGDASDNNEAGVKSAAEVFLFAAGKPLFAEALVKFTDQASNTGNVAFGLADAIGANLLVDNGAGPKTTMSGALIFKVDGGTVWKCISSIGTTQTISTSNTTAGGSSYQKLRIEVRMVTSTVGEVTFFCDDQPLRDSTSNRPIMHRITLGSPTEMQVGAYCKSGAATANFQLLVDYIYAAQKR